jgi:hypothetical protein
MEDGARADELAGIISRLLLPQIHSDLRDLKRMMLTS